MASLAMMLGGAITNALAFSGSNFLFSHMGSHANEEKIRHDKAVEKLETAQAAWSKARTERLDFLHEQEKKEQQGTLEYENVDQAMKAYYYATKDHETDRRSDPGFETGNSPRPTLSDFYTPSEDQKKREIAFVVLGMSLTGFITWKIYKYENKN